MRSINRVGVGFGMSSPVLRLGSLFTGRGGLDLGLERAGVSACWQVEKNPARRAQLARQWPGTKKYSDITSVDFTSVQKVDVLAGGFPCQGISRAGLQRGMADERSGLWREFARAIGDLQPRYIVVENDVRLAIRGLGTVLGDLARLGYDAEWSTLSACALGAPHTRERLFVLAYPNDLGREEGRAERDGDGGPVVEWGVGPEHIQASAFDCVREAREHWLSEPGVDRVVNGLAPGGADEIASFGDSVVPFVSQLIGTWIVGDHLRRRVAE